MRFLLVNTSLAGKGNIPLNIPIEAGGVDLREVEGSRTQAEERVGFGLSREYDGNGLLASEPREDLEAIR